MLDYRKLRRGPQIVLPKDAGFAAAFVGLQGGDRVVDVGAGSGFLAIFLGSVVGPNGRVYSFERRKEFAELAKENIKKAGLQKTVTVIRKDAFKGLRYKNVDLVTLDCGDSDQLVPLAAKALKEKGFVVGFLPNVEQVKAFVEAGEATGLEHVGAWECVAREWLVRDQGCRPKNVGLMHSCFLCFLRKKSFSKK